jgi:membrane protease YdiL (CAAX protease family)
LTPLAAALWSVALTILESVVVAVTDAARPGALTDIVNQAACRVLATSLLCFVMVRLYAREGSLRATFAVRPISPLHVPLAIAAGAGLCPVLSTLQDLVVRRWPLAEDESDTVQRLVASSSPLGLVLAALVAVPIAYELFFRGILYGGVERATSARVAIVSTSVFYACSSLDPRQIPPALALGVAMAWLRERTGTVVAPILAQLAFNAVDGIPILRGRDAAANVTYPSRWIVGGAVIAVLALAAVGAGKREET